MRMMLPSRVLEVLPVPARVARRSAVAEAEVEHPVRPEADRAAVVVRVGLLDLEDHELRIRVGGERVALGVDAEAREPRAARARIGGAIDRVVEPEPAVRGELRVERDAEQAFLVAGAADPWPDVQQQGLAALVEDVDAPVLLGDEDAVPRVRPCGVGPELHRTLELPSAKRR